MKKVITLLVLILLVFLSAVAYAQQKEKTETEAMEELEHEAKKWQELTSCWTPYKPIENKYFTFKGTEQLMVETGACNLSWTATSKIKIGSCPAKSVWKMTGWHEAGMGAGENETPAECKSITPKIITEHKFNEFVE
jgi:hypothetical protein